MIKKLKTRSEKNFFQSLKQKWIVIYKAFSCMND